MPFVHASLRMIFFLSFWPSRHFYCRRICLILLYMLVGVYLLWHERCVSFLGSCSLPFTPWTRCCLDKNLHLSTKPMLSFSMTMGLLATDLAISFYRAYYSFTSLFISCYLVGLRADAPAMLAHFFISFLVKASLAYFPHLYLFWAWLAYIPVILAHFTTSFLGLSLPIYLFSTFFTFMGFLLDSLGFLGLITTSLPPIIIWAYWPLSPIEFTNSFPKLPWPICFFFLLFS